ncbi:hypothetical protein V9T40_014349 [Parthenolecanium corni]|uniref:Schwannomin interacting protein 1 C-terminal domain-containing protein n=1 Tax=Parthenolecanium corni TaxID=536013 RepID=A0AAN9THJ6_9HEMI
MTVTGKWTNQKIKLRTSVWCDVKFVKTYLGTTNFPYVMAVSVLECSNKDNLIAKPSRCLAKRHYKKDSRFVLDLYTLTYDSHESLDSLGDLSKRRIEANTNRDAEITGNVANPKNNNINITTNRKPNQQSRFHSGRTSQSPFLWPPFVRLDDNLFEEEAFSLPIFKSKSVLNFTDINSLPFENPQGTAPSNIIPDFSPKLQEIQEQRDKNNNTHNNIDSKILPSTEVKKETSLLNISKDRTRWMQQLQNEVCLSLKKVYSTTNKQRFNRSTSPVTTSIKSSLKKVGFINWNKSNKSLRMDKSMLDKMDSTQLQIIVNNLHGQIENLNEQLMKMLTERDELHMNRDTLLNHIKDIMACL